jgi:tetratricopeptide (TPR) repeat protein
MSDDKANASTSDNEQFEDANEKIVNELIEETMGTTLTDPPDCDEESESDSENDKDKFKDCVSNDFIDDEAQAELEKDQTEEEREAAKTLSEELKKKGNELFKSGEFLKSSETYTEALQACPVVHSNERSILYGNRGAAKHKLDMKPAAIDDCTKSLEFNPKYVRVYLR